MDRTLHWISALLLLLMLMHLSTLLHNVDWDIKGQLEHRQEAVEMHAITGMLLLVFTVVRLILPFTAKVPIRNVKMHSVFHTLFVKTTHFALFACIFLLSGTGILLVKNYEIPLSILCLDLAPDIDAFYSFFPKVHNIHMFLKQCLWWLIAIHVAGILYAKK